MRPNERPRATATPARSAAFQKGYLSFLSIHHAAADVHELTQRLDRQGRSPTSSEPPSDEPKLLSIKEMDILEVCRGVPSKLPSEKQCPIAVAAYERLKRDGCPY